MPNLHLPTPPQKVSTPKPKSKELHEHAVGRYWLTLDQTVTTEDGEVLPLGMKIYIVQRPKYKKYFIVSDSVNTWNLSKFTMATG